MCTRAKERKHYTDEDIDDDEIEGKRNYSLEEKLHSAQFQGNFVTLMKGDEFNLKFFQEHGLTKPIVFFEKSGLGMRVPSSNFQVSDVKQCVGSRRPLDVMDANTQRGLEMTMKDWVKYYENTDREKLLNVISLEFSHTKLENYVESPTVVRQTDWVDTVWPRIYKKCQTEATNIIEKMKYPKVQKYCLMSVAGCYTDFHVDFGGTSVWYHILHGQKVFWLIPPTEVNIELYVNWILSGKQGDIFLGDQVESCQRIVLAEGYTFVIPSGWIHAVYTPKDSLVFGGNFLHSFNIIEQLNVCEIEEKTHVPQKFRYPFFTEISWYVLDRYLACLTGKSFLQKSVYEIEKDEDSELDDSRPPSRDPEDYSDRNQNRQDEKDPKSSQHKLSKSITIELTRIDEKNFPRASSDEESAPTKGSRSRRGNGTDSKGRDSKRARSPASIDDKSETDDLLNEKDSKEDLYKDSITEGAKFVPKKNVHLTKIELAGLEKLVQWLESLPPAKKNVPKDISEPDQLIKEFKQMLLDHKDDDPQLSVTGEPILQWPPSKKLKPKLKMGHMGKGKLSGKNAAAQAASNIRRRRTRCKKCEPCTRQECAECHFCKDMKKFGGPGRMKQSCISRQCMAPVLPLSAACMICGKEGTTEKENIEDSVSALMECGICWEIVHPNCFKLKNENIDGEGVINEDLPNSWECPKCCQDGKRGQTKPRVIKCQPKPKAIESRHSSTSSEDVSSETSVVPNLKQEPPPLFEGKRVTAKESSSNNSNNTTAPKETTVPKPTVKDEPVASSQIKKEGPEENPEGQNKRKLDSKVPPKTNKTIPLKKKRLNNDRPKCESSQLGTLMTRRMKWSNNLAGSDAASCSNPVSASVSRRPRRERLVDSSSDRQPPSFRFQLRKRTQRQKRQKAVGRRSRGGSGPIRQAAVAAQAKLLAAESDLPLDEDDDFVGCCSNVKTSANSETKPLKDNYVTESNVQASTSTADIRVNESLNVKSKSSSLEESDQQMMREVRLEPPIYVVRPAPVPPPPDFITLNSEEIHVLRQDHWMRVFSFLNAADLVRCMCVCKTWHSWCINHTLWTTVDLSGRLIKQQHLIGTVCRQPKCLNLTSSFFSYKQLFWLIARLPQLERLLLCNCCWSTISALCSSSCPLLRSLDVSWATGMHGDCFRDLILPQIDRKPGMRDVSRLCKLKQLIASGTELTDNVMNIITEHMPQLELLDISYCTRVTDQAIANLACSLACRQKLKKINISGCQYITEKCLQHFKNFDNLHTLDFKGCAKIPFSALETFVSAYTNQKLVLNEDKLITNATP
ncbi:lysine-specific demethylase 2A-like isoform X3 [Octopus vulgaris]|uniref:[histone H3]-dimethyl-L-lysine(36) demethylase n=1 Tax=Octopus vulgaris TaxID=6645 RepID=A0AA36BJG1_OCTVU|nr:lysine-specific demethylase 2A-like isoform X3 [Octopus vulgaris]